tara:strand:+ start:728 stop:2107 length:1380 start_codon:yes stop_codon:yes gene_type:complete
MELIFKEDEIDTEALRQKLEEYEEYQLKQREEAKNKKEELLNEIKLQDWLGYQTSDETEIIKDISKVYSVNLTDARAMIGGLPTEPLIDNKTIPEITKELRILRRQLKGNARDKISKTVDHLINAYTIYLNDCIKSIYWVTPYTKPLKTMTPDMKMIRKLEYIKDGETRKAIVGHLKDMWEAETMKSGLDYGADYCKYSTIVKDSKKGIREILKNITHQSIRKSRQDNLNDIIIKSVCLEPGISSNKLHAILPKAYHDSTTPQTISKMLKRLDITNVDGEYYLLSNEIKKDLYSYIAGFIDSDGYITMDSSHSPRIGMVATGKRGKAFFQELEKELKIGRLHLDQKVGENNRSQHRLNFYKQDDIVKLLDKCIPHLRMKQEQGKLLMEAIRIKKNYKRETWAKDRVGEIFKLIKYENWKDARNKWEFDKYGINEEDIAKYRVNCKMSYMDELDSIVKED